jgi:capsid protein
MFIGSPDKAPPGVYDGSGLPVERFEPGMFLHARGGKDIKFNTPTALPGYEAYKRSMLHTIAAGWRVPYELLSGDPSQVNYSSIRAGLTEFRRLIEAIQHQLIVAMFLRRVGGWFVEAHVLSGDISAEEADLIAWEWTPPKWFSVDPLKDVMADMLEVRGGFADVTPAGLTVLAESAVEV